MWWLESDVAVGRWTGDRHLERAHWKEVVENAMQDVTIEYADNERNTES